MRTIPWMFLVVALTVAVGCQSTSSPVAPPVAPIVKPAPAVSAAPTATPPAAPVVSVVGKNVQAVLAASPGLRCEFYTLDDKPLDARIDQAAGSVSIYAADGSGQDNYRFDAAGTIDRHLRSYGGDFAAGIWTPAP